MRTHAVERAYPAFGSAAWQTRSVLRHGAAGAPSHAWSQHMALRLQQPERGAGHRIARRCSERRKSDIRVQVQYGSYGAERPSRAHL